MWQQEEKLQPGMMRKLISGDKLMLVSMEIDPGTPIPPHSHPHEQISYIVAGEAEFTIGDEVRSMKAGDVCLIPGGVPHSVKVLSKLIVLDCFSPPREDFLKGGKS
ncbi:MAG: cupin domain-containing protein [Firmicutes bacterium]|nr:cupin domain-containing protein [Bacillota bacterium]